MFTNETCRSYIDHMLAEHRRLHRMLTLAHHAVMASDDAWFERFAKHLSDIRSELQAHFAEEEQEGCLDQAVSFAPGLSPKLRLVADEHPRLLAAIDALLAQAHQRGDTPSARCALQEAFDSLCRDLHAHEAAENDILRRGFGVDVNGEANGNGKPAQA
jgi:iron-sulfur cluster repair protein YtfE (RIC family)